MRKFVIAILAFAPLTGIISISALAAKNSNSKAPVINKVKAEWNHQTDLPFCGLKFGDVRIQVQDNIKPVLQVMCN